MWVVLESAMVGSVSTLSGIGCDVKVLGNKVVGASVSKV